MNEPVERAAREAVSELGLSGATYESFLHDEQTSSWSVMFRDGEGRSFRLVVAEDEARDSTGGVSFSGLKEAIKRKLRDRDPDDFLGTH